MAEKTAIEWADSTWNPWQGCHKVSAGCKNCYMFRDMAYYGRDPNVVVRSKTSFDAPRKWERSGTLAPGSAIFTCSWSDWFIEEADEWRADAWAIVSKSAYNFIILTKRHERIHDHLPTDWGDGYPNVCLGVSAENQAMADKRIPVLLTVPAKWRCVSAEPLLGPIDLTKYLLAGWHKFSPRLHWVITGGESDKVAPRPCDLDWVRSIREQCQATGTAFFHKQHGGKTKIGGVWGGRVLDGFTWNERPF